ncbi:MAG: hypothetical protein AAF957_19555 [Planctomycetota bacterium]
MPESRRTPIPLRRRAAPAGCVPAAALAFVFGALGAACIRPSQQIIDLAYQRNLAKLQRSEPIPARTIGRDPVTRLRTEDRSYLDMPDGVRLHHGAHRTWYPDGTPETLRHYREGDEVGVWWSWWRNGALRSAYEFVPGVETPMTWWHPNGLLQSEGMARDGVRTGPWRFWHENGELESEGSFVGGRRAGFWAFYDADGEWTERGRMQAGRRIGDWEFRDRVHQ